MVKFDIRAPRRLVAALNRVASHRLMTRSEYLRQAAVEQLRRDGLDLTQDAPQEEAA